MSTHFIRWSCFLIFILAMMAIDLGIFHKKKHVVTIRESILWTITWIVLALIFDGILWATQGHEIAVNFISGYLVEYSLSVDNIFVFILIFSYFKVPAKYQHKVLFWGILGALIMRGLAIGAGTTLLNHFEWTILLFGAILLFTGVRLFGESNKEIEPEKNPVLKLARRIFPVMPRYVNDRFFIRKDLKTYVTPLFFVLIVVETTDLLFAVDSIPAVLGITSNTFIVFTSNVFAILGLRSLYFAVSGIMQLFRFLNYGLGFILIFVGLKMITDYFGFHFPNYIALLVILMTLLVSIILSVAIPAKEK